MIPDAGAPVGATEIAELLGVERATVAQWQAREVLPGRDWTVGGRPAWRWDTIREWAVSTGRAQRADFPLSARLRYGLRSGTWTSADRAMVLHTWRVTPGRPGCRDAWAWHILLDQEIAATGAMEVAASDPDPGNDGLYALYALIRQVRDERLASRDTNPEYPKALVYQRAADHDSDLIAVSSAVLDRGEFLGEG